MHFLPSTLPMMFMTSDTFALGRRLSMIASGMSSFSVNLRARVTEPRSGETITVSSVPTPNLPAIYGMSTDEPSMLSTGMLKKP